MAPRNIKLPPFSRAKSLRGVWGNLKFIVHYKTWAVIVLVTLAVLLGLSIGQLL